MLLISERKSVWGDNVCAMINFNCSRGGSNPGHQSLKWVKMKDLQKGGRTSVKNRVVHRICIRFFVGYVLEMEINFYVQKR